jgi:hypothetical protein
MERMKKIENLKDKTPRDKKESRFVEFQDYIPGEDDYTVYIDPQKVSAMRMYGFDREGTELLVEGQTYHVMGNLFYVKKVIEGGK